MDIRVLRLQQETYYGLESVQEGAEPVVFLNEDKKIVSVERVWISNHADVPDSSSVAEEVFELASHIFMGFEVIVSIYDLEGKKHIYSRKV